MHYQDTLSCSPSIKYVKLSSMSLYLTIVYTFKKFSSALRINDIRITLVMIIFHGWFFMWWAFIHGNHHYLYKCCNELYIFPLRTHTHIRIRTYVRTFYICTCAHITYIYICMYVQTYVRTYIYIHIHTHT